MPIKLLRWVANKLLIIFTTMLLLSVVVVGLLRWVNPPLSAIMAQHWISAQFHAAPPLHYQWVDWKLIPASVALAVIAAEDQRFPTHNGFDLIEIRNAMTAFQEGERLRGASTISQQTAKNLFLWTGRDYLRKGLEAWLTVLIEMLWSKQRILEIYLNIAQFSPDTYGVAATSWRYFKRPIFTLDAPQAALLAAVLPNPSHYRLTSPSTAVRQRASRIKRQMRQLGGTNYLNQL